MKSDWQICIEVLEEKGMPLEQFVYPEKYRDQATAAKRVKVIKRMHEMGISRKGLTAIGPYSSQYIGRILQNGNGSVDQNLSFGDNLLSLRDEKETQRATDTTGPMEQL